MIKRLLRTNVLAIGLLSVIAILPVSAATTATAAERLIEVTPAETTVKVPAPGHSNDWSMKVTNVSDRELELSFEAFGPGGTALEGEHPLDLSLTGSDQKIYADHAKLADLLDRKLAIPTLAPGESFVMNGAAALPRAAGNEYRTATADVKFRFVAQADDLLIPEKPSPEKVIDIGPVAITGSEAFLVAVLGLALTVIGMTVVVVRKRRGAE